MSRRDNLDALPFSDYADDDPNGQLRLSDEEPPQPERRACEACTADPGEPCRPWCIGGLS